MTRRSSEESCGQSPAGCRDRVQLQPDERISEPSFSRDRCLLRAWQRGDEEKGLELLSHYEAWFLSRCRRYGARSEEEQLDLYQDVVLRILTRLSRLRIESSFGGYLRQVLVSVLRERKEKATRGTPIKNEPRDRRESPMAAVEKDEFWEAAAECEGGLTESEVRVFAGRIFETTSFADLATKLGTSLGNLYVIYFRARRKMRRCMEGKGFSHVG